ncbi:MAG: hypothetical protein ACI9VT_000560 [Psychroserpens sp.]|jgi:hypothetical protein
MFQKIQGKLSLLTNDLVFIANTFNQLSLICKYRQQLSTTEPKLYTLGCFEINFLFCIELCFFSSD